jgi:hypothetical protein
MNWIHALHAILRMRYEQSFFFFSSFKKVTAYVEKVLKTVKYNEIGPVPWRQGDQIGRIFAYWAIVFFWQFF